MLSSRQYIIKLGEVWTCNLHCNAINKCRHQHLVHMPCTDYAQLSPFTPSVPVDNQHHNPSMHNKNTAFEHHNTITPVWFLHNTTDAHPTPMCHVVTGKQAWGSSSEDKATPGSPKENRRTTSTQLAFHVTHNSDWCWKESLHRMETTLTKWTMTYRQTVKKCIERK